MTLTSTANQGASVALIVGAAGHFQRSSDMVHLFGAVGVALKWFSAVWGSMYAANECSVRCIVPNVL
jgi:hypothetical protein